MHPDGKAHGGTALIIRSIKHYKIGKFQREFLQTTGIMVVDQNGCITISATYLLSKHIIKKEQYITFFKTFGNRFIAARDYNAKYIHWGSRLILPKGRELLKAIEAMNLAILSTGEPTYWPSDNKKISDLDFSIIKGIPKDFCRTESCLKLSLDHSLVIFSKQ